MRAYKYDMLPHSILHCQILSFLISVDLLKTYIFIIPLQKLPEANLFSRLGK